MMCERVQCVVVAHVRSHSQQLDVIVVPYRASRSPQAQVMTQLKRVVEEDFEITHDKSYHRLSFKYQMCVQLQSV